MDDKLNELTVKELKAMLDENDVEYSSKATKAELITLAKDNLEFDSEDEDTDASADGAEADSADSEEAGEDETPEEPTKKPVKKTEATLGRQLRPKAQATKDAQAKEPKVRIYVPREQGEPKGSTLPVTINGYRLNIRKGGYVELPESVAKVVIHAYEQEDEVLSGSRFNLDNPDHISRDRNEAVGVGDAL